MYLMASILNIQLSVAISSFFPLLNGAECGYRLDMFGQKVGELRNKDMQNIEQNEEYKWTKKSSKKLLLHSKQHRCFQLLHKLNLFYKIKCTRDYRAFEF